jgi:nitrate reductase gamma subunit
MRSDVLFAAAPYVALALFGAATALRYLIARRRMADLARELSRVRASWRGGVLWRAGAGLLLAGHVAGFVFPRGILAWNASPARLYLLELVAFAAGHRDLQIGAVGFADADAIAEERHVRDAVGVLSVHRDRLRARLDRDDRAHGVRRR